MMELITMICIQFDKKGITQNERLCVSAGVNCYMDHPKESIGLCMKRKILKYKKEITEDTGNVF